VKLEPITTEFGHSFFVIDEDIKDPHRGQLVAIIHDGLGGLVIYRHYSVDPEMILALLPFRLGDRYKVYDCKVSRGEETEDYVMLGKEEVEDPHD